MDRDRLRAYREHLDFYGGVQWSGLSRRSRERRLTFNYARVFIEKVTSYLMSGLVTSIEPADASPQAQAVARRAEDALREVRDANALEQLDFETELDAAVLGDGCYKVFWDAAAQRVRITAPDVQGLYVWWQGDDVGTVWRVASRYAIDADEAEALYGVKRQRAAERTVVEVWTAGRFQLWLDNEALLDQANPYGFIPFIIFPNLRQPKQFWGVSDLVSLKEPSRELNRALSQLSMILELSGNPIAVLENVESAQDIAVAPGAVWEVPEKAKAYLLDLLQGGGVQLHVDYINLLYRVLHDLSESPRTAFGDNERGLSGVALEMELHPLLQKVRRKRLIRAAVYRQRNEMALRILEQKTGERFGQVRQRISWGPLLPQDRSRQVQEEVALVRAGIRSRRRAADELGVDDADAEWKRWLEEQREAGDVLPAAGSNGGAGAVREGP
ncbi:MAG: phage portal protein [Chloroflexi bacterium]|nr:phage portal protein [Chloroflexota bacterium]